MSLEAYSAVSRPGCLTEVRTAEKYGVCATTPLSNVSNVHDDEEL